MEKDKFIIKITSDGPYTVSGGVPLEEKIIVEKDGNNIYEDAHTFPLEKSYCLCRCGKSKNAPFCDGNHIDSNFDGSESASKEKYDDRAAMLDGPGIDLKDDDRCAYTRFCHRDNSDVWSLTLDSADPRKKQEAIKAASDCPSGRLVAVTKDGKEIEPTLEPSIAVLQDPQEDVSGPLFVKGNIPVESATGETYEVRNRVALCRCGKSKNKPFCDATHITCGYKDTLYR